MSRKSLLIAACLLPLALLSIPDTAQAQCQSGGTPAAVPAMAGVPGLGSGNLQGLLFVNQFTASPMQFQQQQRLFYLQRQRMLFLQQQEWERLRAQAEADRKAAEEKAAAEKEKEEPKKEFTKTRVPHGLTADQRIQRSLSRLERDNGLSTHR
ncbi:MAG: hypothetical protein HUJ26_18345 [Planctomycetaceae bacterium]|nr:hypothetical protein [Planctomycetaceae bacterium]